MIISAVEQLRATHCTAGLTGKDFSVIYSLVNINIKTRMKTRHLTFFGTLRLRRQLTELLQSFMSEQLKTQRKRLL